MGLYCRGCTSFKKLDLIILLPGWKSYNERLETGL